MATKGASTSGTQRLNAVESDKVWRNRVEREHQKEREWSQNASEASSQVSSPKGPVSASSVAFGTTGKSAAALAAASTSGTASSAAPALEGERVALELLSPEQISSIEKELQRAQYVTTSRSTYKVGKPVELFALRKPRSVIKDE